MKDYIVFGNYSSIDSGTLIFPKEIDNAPKRDVEKIQVPGRNGSLIIDNGRYEDVKQSYGGIIYDHARFDEYITKLKNGLLGSAGYKRLSDSFRPHEYRMAYLDEDFSPNVVRLWKQMGKFELNFTCKPQRFLTAGEEVITFTSTGTLYNPSVYPAQPFLRVYGYGHFSIGDYGVTVAQGLRPYTDIDCARMDAYYNTVNCNNLITLDSDFPVLLAGTSDVIFDQTFTSIRVTPNWWVL